MAQKRLSDLASVDELNGGELIEVSQPSNDVTISATTISADAADNSFNDSGAGFETAGFAAGDRVKVTGFATGANNLFVGIVTALTAGKMTIGGTDGDPIATEAAGADVTISKWVSRRATVQDISAMISASSSTVKTEAGNYTVDPDDATCYIRLTSALAKNVTVQPEATTALPANAEWHFRNVGAGDATFVEGSGVTINPPNGGTLDVPSGGTVTLKRVAEDEFDLLGQTVAA